MGMKMGMKMATTRRLVLSGASVLAITVALSQAQPAYATCVANGGGSITSNCDTFSPTSSVTVVSGVTISGTTGITANSSIASLTNFGTISGNYGVNNNSTISTVTNSGNIVSSSTVGFFNNGNGSITSLTNSGTISGNSVGLKNNGTISTVTNTGTISSSSYGVYNNVGSIGSISNSGTISGNTYGIYNSSGTIGTLNNSGRIIATGGSGVYSDGTITSLINTGTISGTNRGIESSGTILTLTNSGTITASSGYALQLDHSANLITNSGLISGTINFTSANQTMAGGTGSTFGTLSGGTIYTGGSHTLTLSSGNIWLQDALNGNLSITGATVKLSSTVSITGGTSSYRQTGGSLYIVTSNSGSTYGYVTVAGAATVSNTSITISGSGLTAGETFTIVRSGTSGSYSNDTASVTGTSNLTASTSTVGNNLVVTLAAGSTTVSTAASSSGGSAASVAKTLDVINNSSSATATAFKSAVINKITALSGTAQVAAIKQLTPQTPAIAQTAAITTAPSSTAVSQRQQALLDDGGSGLGAAAGSGTHDYGLWGQVLSGGAMRDSTADAAGYRSRDFGLITGLDYRINQDTSVGTALSWVRGWNWGADNASGSLSMVDSYQITTYGTERFGQAFVTGQLGFGYNHVNQTRSINSLGQAAYSTYGGEQYLAKAGGGYDLPMNGFTVTPTAGLTFLRSVSDGYTETGSSDNLTVERRGVQSLSHDLGAKVSTRFDSAWGSFKPEASLAWLHDYNSGPIASSGIMGGSFFSSTVARPSADGARLNLATTLEKSDDISLRFEYEGEVRHDYQSHTGMIKVTGSF